MTCREKRRMSGYAEQGIERPQRRLHDVVNDCLRQCVISMDEAKEFLHD